MLVSIRDLRHSRSDRAWFESVYRDYVLELASQSSNTGVFPVSVDLGTREPDLLASWFANSASYPLSILRDAQPVGFALITRPPAAGPRERIDYRMAEFYITQSARRLGIGRDAVRLIFSRFAGKWEVTEFQYNRSAVAFWRSVISQCTRGQYRESVVSGEVKQVFTTASPRNAN